MRYKVRQRIFSLGDNFTIKDALDRDQFIVRGRVFAIGDKLKIEDMEGRELIYIEQQVFRFLPEYYIYSNGKQMARVKKEFAFFKPRFLIESTLGKYEMIGDFFAHDFQITKNGRGVANVSKKWLSLADTYRVDIDDSEDQAFMLALIIVIDQVLHDKNHNNR